MRRQTKKLHLRAPKRHDTSHALSRAPADRSELCVLSPVAAEELLEDGRTSAFSRPVCPPRGCGFVPSSTTFDAGQYPMLPHPLSTGSSWVPRAVARWAFHGGPLWAATARVSPACHAARCTRTPARSCRWLRRLIESRPRVPGNPDLLPPSWEPEDDFRIRSNPGRQLKSTPFSPSSWEGRFLQQSCDRASLPRSRGPNERNRHVNDHRSSCEGRQFSPRLRWLEALSPSGSYTVLCFRHAREARSPGCRIPSDSRLGPKSRRST